MQGDDTQCAQRTEHAPAITASCGSRARRRRRRFKAIHIDLDGKRMRWSMRGASLPVKCLESLRLRSFRSGATHSVRWRCKSASTAFTRCARRRPNSAARPRACQWHPCVNGAGCVPAQNELGAAPGWMHAPSSPVVPQLGTVEVPDQAGPTGQTPAGLGVHSVVVTSSSMMLSQL